MVSQSRCLVKDLDEGAERHAKENLFEEQLAVFDIVTQHEKIELTKKEIR